MSGIQKGLFDSMNVNAKGPMVGPLLMPSHSGEDRSKSKPGAERRGNWLFSFL